MYLLWHDSDEEQIFCFMDYSVFFFIVIILKNILSIQMKFALYKFCSAIKRSVREQHFLNFFSTPI